MRHLHNGRDARATRNVRSEYSGVTVVAAGWTYAARPRKIVTGDPPALPRRVPTVGVLSMRRLNSGTVPAIRYGTSRPPTPRPDGEGGMRLRRREVGRLHARGTRAGARRQLDRRASLVLRALRPEHNSKNSPRPSLRTAREVILTSESASQLSLSRPARRTLPTSRDRNGFFKSLLSALASYFPRHCALKQFHWNVSPEKVRDVRPEAVYCVELPVKKAADMLLGYIRAGVAPDHVVFAGDPETLTDREYGAITRKGALVHDTPKKARRRTTEHGLATFFATTREANIPLQPRPYSYTPAPPQVTPEQLQGYVEAIGRRGR